MGSAWLVPDAEPWRDEERYNPQVSTALACARAKLRPDGRVEGEVVAVLACLAPVLDAEMSNSQRLRVLYLVCACRATEDPPTPALDPIDEALTLAIELQETRAQVDLLLLRAYVNRCIAQIPDAADDLGDCLELLLTLNLHDDWRPEDARKTLIAIVRRSTQMFLLGAYDECQLWLDKATELLPQVGEDTDAQGRLAWMRALLLRWRGDYNAALTEAVAALGYYRRLHDPEMLSRIEGETGQVLLDLAEQSRARGDEPSCDAYLAQAEPYIARAIQIAVASDFMGSELLARIIRSRWLLLQGAPGDRRPLLEELARIAWEHQDMASVCKAYTGIGRECEATHDVTAAKDWYRRAIAVLKESKTVADAVWAQRALWHLEGEMTGLPSREV
jgi:tetratricopeptide (TPR) repeat protein